MLSLKGLLFLFLCTWCQCGPLVLLPTADEIARGIPSVVPRSWVKPFFRRGLPSIRTLIIGGSNTYKEGDKLKYPNLLDKRLHEVFGLDSYVINMGMPGAGPDRFIEARYEFENKSYDKWPNLVILEFSITCLSNIICPRDTDILIQYLKKKYELRSLTPPSFLLLDIFSPVRYYANVVEDTRQGRQQALNSADSASSRGSFASMLLIELARFYNYPVVSFTDAYWPSFVRYFVQNPASNLWSFIRDDTIHLNEAGHVEVVDKLLMPFLLKVIGDKNSAGASKSHQQVSQFGPYDYDVRMFPDNVYSVVGILKWSIWKDSDSSMEPIIHSTPENSWKIQKTLRHDIDHNCYGSTDITTKGGFTVQVPLECDGETNARCELSFLYIFSWNRTYVGDCNCKLYTLHPATNTPTVISDHKIIGNIYQNAVVRDTRPRLVVLDRNIKSGQYTVECEKLDSNLSCFSEVQISITSLLNDERVRNRRRN